MGLYDEVLIKCPKCNKDQYAQSKDGRCNMDSYELDNCPEDVLSDVNRHAPFICSGCGQKFIVNTLTKNTIPVVEEGEEDVDYLEIVLHKILSKKYGKSVTVEGYYTNGTTCVVEYLDGWVAFPEKEVIDMWEILNFVLERIKL